MYSVSEYQARSQNRWLDSYTIIENSLLIYLGTLQGKNLNKQDEMQVGYVTIYFLQIGRHLYLIFLLTLDLQYIAL